MNELARQRVAIAHPTIVAAVTRWPRQPRVHGTMWHDADGCQESGTHDSITSTAKLSPVSVPGLFPCRCGDGKGGSHPFDVEVRCHVFAERWLGEEGSF